MRYVVNCVLNLYFWIFFVSVTERDWFQISLILSQLHFRFHSILLSQLIYPYHKLIPAFKYINSHSPSPRFYSINHPCSTFPGYIPLFIPSQFYISLVPMSFKKFYEWLFGFWRIFVGSVTKLERIWKIKTTKIEKTQIYLILNFNINKMVFFHLHPKSMV